MSAFIAIRKRVGHQGIAVWWLLPCNVHIAKLTSLMGTFLWANRSERIPMHQLALPLKKGGLKLQLPAFKCKALLLNRHLKELESIPFYGAYVRNQTLIPPISCPCLKAIRQLLPTLPMPIQANPSAGAIHRHLLEAIEPAKVERDNPQVEWQCVRRTIASKKLESTERSWYYMLTNRKLIHQNLLFRTNRVNIPACLYCGAAIEDLCHKYSTCSTVEDGWRCLQ